MDCSWTIDRSDGITFVAAQLDNPASVPRRVRLANRLDGPVLPPRREGRPERSFDADGVTVGVPANESRSVGFACPAQPRDPPVELVDVERVEDADSVATATATTVALADLGAAHPPRDVIPAASRPDAVSAESSQDAVAAWFDAVERRIERGERLTNASVSTATTVLRETGGLDAVSTLDESLASDADRLHEVATRAAALAERAEAADVPIEALRRMA